MKIKDRKKDCIYKYIMYIIPRRPTVKEEQDLMNDMLGTDDHVKQDSELSDLD